jgi:hypothetical protein
VHKFCLLRSLTSPIPPPWYPGFPPLPMFLYLSPHPHDFSPVLLGSLLTTSLQLSPSRFSEQHTGHFRTQEFISLKHSPWCPCFLPLSLLHHPPSKAYDSLTRFLSFTRRFPANCLTTFPVSFRRPAKLTPFRAILISCYFLLLVRLVIGWMPMGADNFILSHRRANGN